MRINSFSAIQRNNYRGKNKQVSFGLPPVIEKMNLSENITIPTPMRISQEALKAEIKLKEEMKQYNKDYQNVKIQLHHMMLVLRIIIMTKLYFVIDFVFIKTI